MSEYLTNNWKLAAGVSAAVVASGAAAGLLASNLRQKPVEPKKWVKVGTVTNLILYPIKSCQGIYVEEATAEMIGLKASEYLRDRVFMVVDSRWVFQTQRTIPRMALVRTEIIGNQLILSAQGRESVTVNIPNDEPKLRKSCRIFDDHVATVLDCGDEVGQWLDGFLEKGGLRLVYHPQDKTQRALNSLQKKFPDFVPSDKGAFHDQTSYMMISEDSVDDLNKVLDKPVSHRNFRPSILINGTPEPFCEDFWGFVKVGAEGPVFKMAKPCTRCKLTTVNPDTGDFDEKGNPLSALTKMQRTMGNEVIDRLVKNQGIIGVQFGLLEGTGKTLKIGDPVYAAVL